MKRSYVNTACITALLASVSIGCSSAGPNATTGGNKGGETGSKDKLALNIMTISYEGGGWPEKHPVVEFLNQKFNVDLKIQWIPNDNYKEKLGVYAASNEFPDAFIMRRDDYMKWRDKGVYMDVKPVIDKYPNLYKQLGGTEAFQYLNPPGKYFGLPYYSIETRDSLGIRKDWLDKLGLKMPETIDELYEVLKAFTFRDPDGNGKNDTIGLSMSISENRRYNHIQPIEYAFGLANGWKLEGDKLIPWQAQLKELKDFAGFLRKAYAEGVLDKDFAVNKLKDPQYKFDSGKTGITSIVPTTMAYTVIPSLKKIDPKAELAQLPPPAGPNGSRGTITNPGDQKVVINGKINKDKQERLLEIMDYLVSDEGNILAKNGIEGVHYTKKDGNKFEKTEAFDKERPFLLSTWLIRRVDPNIQVRLWDDQEVVKMTNKWFEVNAKYRYPNQGAAFDSETAIKTGASLDQKLVETMTNIIIGSQPLDALDQAVEKWKKDGGDKIIAEINEQYMKSK